MNSRLLACVILICLPPTTQAQEQVHGKLFSSDEQREYLDYKRKEYLTKNKQNGFDIQESQVPEIPGNAPNAATAAPTIYSLSGIMKRSDGRLSIWFNDQRLSEDQLPAGVRVVRDGASLALQVKLDNGKTQLLRTGQSIDLSNGTLQEHYHRPEPPAAASPVKQDSKPAATPEAKAPEAKSPAAKSPTADTPPPAAANTPLASKEALDALLGNISSNPQALDTMIQSLQAVRNGQNAQKQP